MNTYHKDDAVKIYKIYSYSKLLLELLWIFFHFLTYDINVVYFYTRY